MRKLFFISILLIALGCYSDENEDASQELPASSNFELSENIIGKWNMQNSAKNAVTCRIFNIVFSQNEFTINYTGGKINGTYTVNSETEISLSSTGNITNILISNGNISLNISIDGCEVNANGVKDDTYNDGDCLTFLECLKGFYFSEDGEIDDAVITFFNEPNGLYYEAYYFYDNCYDIENPFNSESVGGYSVELIQNINNELILKVVEGDDVSFVKLIYFEDGSLSISRSENFDGVYGDNEDYIKITQAKVFQLQGILESLNECEELTYIPDNKFEQYLIDNGYDDELDDYVLTDNIVDIEEINYLHGGIESLEGIQDFTNLKRLILFNYPDFVTKVNDADLQQRIDAGLKNNIQFADFTNNKKLVYVSLGRNIALESINIDGLTELIGLVLEGCQNLSSINLNTNTKLEWLNLGFNNKITEIELNNLLELGRLHLRATGNLNSLDISNNSKIVDLDTQFTNLTCVKVSNYQIQNQINSNSIDGELRFTVRFSDISGQVFDVNWEKDSNTVYLTDCD